MRLLDISTNCYAHLVDNKIYVYVDNEFSELLHIDNVEAIENPLPLILYELELSSRASLYESMQFLN